MNVAVDVFFHPGDDDEWSVIAGSTATSIMVDRLSIHWTGPDHQARAVRMLRAIADHIEAGPDAAGQS